ncbi:hypothetical protein BEI46_09720 [Aliivibrio fischeri]|uniref:antiviral reverse transcriptase Drt3a n=1 Tax=Aliivibrio fischeri TaxID=668 RepID=UPI00084CD982|nr:antiviral reverse transcriptase Drt3a [Aliivibrio fischeri]OED55772.1 hypothetical protein BEI46_09720 [Aliivibrio fischeri]
MLDQGFNVKSLLKLTTRHEIIKFSLGKNKDDYKEKLNIISDNIENENFEFNNIQSIVINDNKVIVTDSPEEHYAIKKIALNLKRLYKISTRNRDEISEQVLRILETSSNYSVVRIDIKKFYDNVCYNKLLEKLQNDKLLTSKSLSLLSEIMNNKTINPKTKNTIGLPRGLAISPVLSEIFIRDIDIKIRETYGVYYYARYVDDIIIIASRPCDEIFTAVKKILKDFNLKTNNKTCKFNIGNVDNKSDEVQLTFEYLGYKYIISNHTHIDKRIINVHLTSDKIRKIKSRIIHSLLDRTSSNAPTFYKKKILLERIKILAGNYPIASTKEEQGILKSGIFYSNRLVNNSGVFNEFNIFLKKALFTQKKNSFGKKNENYT